MEINLKLSLPKLVVKESTKGLSRKFFDLVKILEAFRDFEVTIVARREMLLTFRGALKFTFKWKGQQEMTDIFTL